MQPGQFVPGTPPPPGYYPPVPAGQFPPPPPAAAGPSFPPGQYPGTPTIAVPPIIAGQLPPMPAGVQPGAFSGPPVPAGPPPGPFSGQPGAFGGGQPFPSQAPVPPAPVPTGYYGQPPTPPPSAPPLPARPAAILPVPDATQAAPAQVPVPPLPSRRPGRQQADDSGQPTGGRHSQAESARGFEPQAADAQGSGSWFTATRGTATTGAGDATLPSAVPGPVSAAEAVTPLQELPRRGGQRAERPGEDFRGQPEPTTRVPQGFPQSWPDEPGSVPPGFEAPDHRDDQDLADPDFGSRGYRPAGYPQAPEFGERTRFDETRLDSGGFDSTRLDRVPVSEPKRRSDRKKTPAAAGGSHDAAPTLVDQPRLEGAPVYQTGMQLVVPAGQEWTFRDPGTGAFPGVQPDRFGDQEQHDAYGRGGQGTIPPRGQWAADPPAPPFSPLPDRGRTESAGRLADAPPGRLGGAPPEYRADAPAERKRGRKAPVFIGVGAVVVVLGIGAAVGAPKLLHHTDPGCTAYTASALPAYNQTISDLNAQASQATLSGDLTTALAQLSAAAGQAQGAAVKSALQGLVTQLTQVQADVQKGSVPATTVTQLNTASAAADSACSS